MRNRKEEIKSKGFKMTPAELQDTRNFEENGFVPVDFGKIKVGVSTLKDAILDLGDYGKIEKRYADKETVLRSIFERNSQEMRSISNFYYKTSGIYRRLCEYLAFMYRYDWMITPYINDDLATDKDKDKALEDFYKILLYLDNSELKKCFREIALKIILNGCYYGYLVPSQKRIIIQELPVDYCRSRFNVGGKPVIEFNMKYFDNTFKDATLRNKMLNLFPAEFKKGYKLYKTGKLVPQFAGDSAGWFLLDTEASIKFISMEMTHLYLCQLFHL